MIEAEEAMDHETEMIEALNQEAIVTEALNHELKVEMIIIVDQEILGGINYEN